jgi:hypothetical protein
MYWRRMALPEIVEVPLADLLLDPTNARLGEGLTSQPDTALALAQQQGDNIVRMAQDIVVNSSPSRRGEISLGGVLSGVKRTP